MMSKIKMLKTVNCKVRGRNSGFRRGVEYDATYAGYLPDGSYEPVVAPVKIEHLAVEYDG